MTTVTVELSLEELSMIGYALKEMGSRRAEQALDRGQPNTDAKAHWDLADRVYSQAKQVK